MSKQNTQLENLTAERMVLGKILQAESSFWQVADVLQAAHFSRDIHQRIYQSVRDILTEGKKMSLALVESRIGSEYDEDGKSTASLLTALLRDAEDNESALEEVEQIIDLWRHRTLIATLEKGLKEAKKPGVIPTDLLAEMEVRIQDIGVNSQAEPLKSLGTIADRVMIRSTKSRNTGFVPGFDTGLTSLDEILGRIHEGDLGFIAAQPGDGKTLVGMQIAKRASLYTPVLYDQLEMRDEDMAARVLAGEANVSVAEIEQGSYDALARQDLLNARDQLKDSQIFIDDRPKQTIEQIRDRAVYMKRSKGLGLIVIDHLRLVQTGRRFNNKFDRMEYVTGEAKALAKHLGIACIVLSQVTRASQRRDDPFPQLTDMDGGGAADQDADWAISLFRRDRWLKHQKPDDMDSKDGRDWVEELRRWKNRIQIRVLKRRRGEDGETREFEFDGRRGQLREIER